MVISIIALLIALLMPALGLARENALDTMCKNNLRSLGQVTYVYAQDNDSKFPDWRTALPTNWNNNRIVKPGRRSTVKAFRPMDRSTLMPYISTQHTNMLVCPVFSRLFLNEDLRDIAWTYPMNWNIDPGSASRYDGEAVDSLDKARNPSNLGIFVEENGFRLTPLFDPMNDGRTVAPDWPNRNDTLGTFHRPFGRGYASKLPLIEPDNNLYNGVAFVSFADGHVDWRDTLQTVATLRDDPAKIKPNQRFR